MNHPRFQTTVPRGRRQRGLAIVEFVIFLPVLLLLMLATAEFGRMLFQYNALTKGVRDGARYLSNNAFLGSSQIVNSTARTAAENLVVCGKTACVAGDELLPGLTSATVWTDVTPGANHVSVWADYAYQPMLGSVLPTFGIGSNIPLTITLQASVTKRVL